MQTLSTIAFSFVLGEAALSNLGFVALPDEYAY